MARSAATPPDTVPPDEAADVTYLRAALALARRGLGRVAPNPAVGCVLVKDGRVVGRGWTQPGGRPHAETEALARAGAAASGATAYVTLEPCSHFGKTPPCADAMIAAGIRRCVVSLEDPDPRVSGQGLDRMRSAGIEVAVGLLAAEAAELNAGYLLRQRAGRPLVALKLASTLDGRIATGSGDSRWVTGPAARARVHLLRANHDAIMVGTGTALADDPRLDVRLAGLEGASPLRVVLDSRLRIPESHDLIAGAGDRPTLLVTADGHTDTTLAPYLRLGVEILAVPTTSEGELSLGEILVGLGARGMTRLLVEGGGYLAASLLRADLVDRLHWFRSPALIGADGVPAVGELGVARMAEGRQFRSYRAHRLDKDTLESLVRADPEREML